MVFLAIQMPYLRGTELARVIPGGLKFILNTAHARYALRDSGLMKIWLKDGKKPVLSLSTLKTLELRLSGDRFMRVLRSFIVNHETVRAIELGCIV